MKFQRIWQAVNFSPWLITPSAHASIRRLLDLKATKADDGDGFLEQFIEEPPQMTISDGVAVIPIKGIIGHGLGKLEKSCGACGCEDVSANIKAALADDSVTHICFDMCSPGGTVTGVPELASEMAEAASQKPCMAYCDDQASSAAYWLASGCTAFYASTSAEVGSVGVYMPWLDQTAAFEKAGLKMTVIKNKEGSFKGMGIPGTKLTDEQMQHLQERVDQVYSMFTSHILAHRSVQPEAMRGQSMLAADAKAAGLIDEVCGWDQAIEDLKTL